MGGPPNLYLRMLSGCHLSERKLMDFVMRKRARSRQTLHGAVCTSTRSTLGSVTAEMAQVDHRIGQSFEGIVDIGDELVANQHTTKLVLPGEHAFDGGEAFFEDGRTEHALGSALGGLSVTRVLIDIWNHPPVEDRFAIGLAVVDTIQTDDAPSKIDANGLGDSSQLRQCLAQQRGLIAVARCRYERRDHVAVAIAERHDLVAFEMLVPAKAKVIAALLGDGCSSIAVNDQDVEQVAC